MMYTEYRKLDHYNFRNDIFDFLSFVFNTENMFYENMTVFIDLISSSVPHL